LGSFIGSSLGIVACLEPPASPARLDKARVSAVASGADRHLQPEPGSTLVPSQRSSSRAGHSTKMGDTSSPDSDHKQSTPPALWPCKTMTTTRIACYLSLAALVAGCAAPTQVPSDAPPSTVPGEPPRPGQAPPNVLAAEVTWMRQLFDGTPVVIASEPDGSMRVDVPMQFSFDAKSNAPKPPLRAVMDKVAVSMARQASSKVHLATPGPVARGAAMRNYLQGRGVIGLRVVVLAPPQTGDAVMLRVVPGPIAIDKLDDKNLPPPTNAFPANRAKTAP
jgi:hypothetical protein